MINKNNRRIATSVMAVMCIAFLSQEANAQTGAAADEKGFQPNRDYLALQPFEAIDTASGNVVLTFTDLTLPANNGRSLTFSRVYNNGSSAGQWTFSVGGLPLQVTSAEANLVGIQIQDSIQGEQAHTPSFFMPDGSTARTVFLNAPN